MHFLCFNKPFLEEGQCLKAGECALLFREMKRNSLCFLLCIMRSIGSHFDEGVHMVFWTLGTSFISKMGLFFSAFPNLKM